MPRTYVHRLCDSFEKKAIDLQYIAWKKNIMNYIHVSETALFHLTYVLYFRLHLQSTPKKASPIQQYLSMRKNLLKIRNNVFFI